MLTGEQIRAGRALVRMDQTVLAQASGVSLPTIKRLEATPGPISANTATEEAIRAALSEAGIVFIDADDAGAGVRLRGAGHPLKIRARVDDGLARFHQEGVNPVEIRLQMVEATIFARQLGLDDCPKTYEGIPVAVDPYRASHLRGGRPGVATRVSLPI